MGERTELLGSTLALVLGLAALSLASGHPASARAAQRSQDLCWSAAKPNHEVSCAGKADGHGERGAAGPENGNGSSIVERSKPAPVIVIGFVGGFVRKGNGVHSPVKVAASLRQAYPEGVHVEVFENHHREDAYRRVLQLLDADRAGPPSEDRKRAAQIIIYGMSWGGAETVTLARELKKQKIPVLLTIQVDSVTLGKFGENDGVIPANVAEAVNFYQNDGLLHGRAQIRAEDSSRTRILGNYRYAYKKSAPSCGAYPWWDRWLAKYHTSIECDDAVWNRVEGLIREKLSAPAEK